jgi:hypothetical protein
MRLSVEAESDSHGTNGGECLSHQRAQGERASSRAAWRRRVWDGRGTAVALVDIGNLKQLFPWWADLARRDRRRVLRHVPSPPWLWAVTITLVGLLGCAGAHYFAYRAWRTVAPPARPFNGQSSFLIETVIVALGIGWVVRCAWLRLCRPIRIVRAFLTERLCPTCGQSLESLPVLSTVALSARSAGRRGACHGPLLMRRASD